MAANSIASRCMCAATAIFAALLTAAQPAAAQGEDNFYARKNIRFLVGTAAGGGFSTYAMLLAPHLGKHVPGNPSVTVEHMPGAGGINSLNYLANAAPRDGTAIAIAMPNFFVTPWTEPNATKFDPMEFRFLGRMSDFGRVLAVWSKTGVRSVEDLKTRPVSIGASSRRSTTSVGPVLMNEILGTRMKIVTGYTGTGPTMIAIERGEVDGTTVAWATLSSLKADWLRDGAITVLASMDFTRPPLPGVPRVRDLIADDKDRALWDFVALPAEFGTAVLVAPGVPADRLAILKKAFDAAVQSAEFRTEAQARKLDLNPKSGDELDKLFVQFGKPSPAIAERVSRVMGVKQ